MTAVPTLYQVLVSDLGNVESVYWVLADRLGSSLTEEWSEEDHL